MCVEMCDLTDGPAGGKCARGGMVERGWKCRGTLTGNQGGFPTTEVNLHATYQSYNPQGLMFTIATDVRLWLAHMCSPERAMTGIGFASGLHKKRDMASVAV